MSFRRDFINAWKEVPGILKQFALDCWYAPTWLKVTNGIWLIILISLFWYSVSWFVNMTETLNPEPHTWQSGLLGATLLLFPFITVFAVFAIKYVYEWVATKILLHFGFIEESK